MIFAPLARGAVSLWAYLPVIMVVFALLFLYLWKLPELKNRTKTKLDIAIILFLALAFISLFFSIYKYESFLALLRLLSILAVFCLVREVFDKKMIVRFIILVVSLGSILSILGLAQYFLGLNHSWWIPNQFIAATYVNHNHFSGYLELVIPLIIGLLLAYKSWPVQGNYKKILRILLIAILAIVILAFVFSQSRGAWVCLTVSVIFMAVVLVRKKFLSKTRLLIFLFCIILGAVYIAGGEDAVTKRFRTFQDFNSENFIDGRMRIWEGSIEIIKNNPVIGTGIGTFVWAFPQYRQKELNVRARFAHNDYLHIAAEMGIMAALLMIFIFGYLIVYGVKRVSHKYANRFSQPKKLFSIRDGILLGCAVGILSLSLHGLVDFNFHILANILMVAALAGIITSRKIDKSL